MYARTPRKRPMSDDGERADLVGYLMFVSSRVSNNSSYFDFFVGDDVKEHRIVCFNSDTRNALCKLKNKGVMLTKLKVDGTSFVFDRFSNCAEKQPTFSFKSEYKVAPTSLKNAIESEPMYARVTVIIKVVSSDSPGITQDGLNFKSYDVLDNSITSARKLTVYDDLINVMEVEMSYKLTNVTVSKFNGQRMLKASERTKIIADNSTSISEPKVPLEASAGTIVSIDISSLQKKLACPDCKKELPTNNNLFISCDSCNEGYSKSSLIETGSVYFTHLKKVAEDFLLNMTSWRNS